MKGEANNMLTKQLFINTENNLLIAQLLSPGPQSFTKVYQMVPGGMTFSFLEEAEINLRIQGHPRTQSHLFGQLCLQLHPNLQSFKANPTIFPLYK